MASPSACAPLDMSQPYTTLSPHTIAIIKQTAPLLEQHGELLTRHFYQRMFRENPEVKSLFNATHQATGTQQRALAGAICAFASHVDHLDLLGSAVERIAQKHAGLRILPNHYPIVGKNLLASIREVLGNAATAEVIEAWSQAYHFLAGILIGREQQIYEHQQQTPHGWTGFKTFRISKIQKENDLIRSLYLVPADNSPVPSYLPGQYLTVRVPDSTSGTTMRNYSLSSTPHPDHFRISVKAEPAGTVSSFLHQRQVGDTLEIAPPCGEFFLDPFIPAQRPLALLAGGIGITPILAMLEATLIHQPHRPIHLIHGSLNSHTHAFRDTVLKLAANNPQLIVHFVYSQPTELDRQSSRNHYEGFIDAETLDRFLPSRDCDYYFCGPTPFMATIHRQLVAWNIPPSQVHFEHFGPHTNQDPDHQSISSTISMEPS